MSCRENFFSKPDSSITKIFIKLIAKAIFLAETTLLDSSTGNDKGRTLNGVYLYTLRNSSSDRRFAAFSPSAMRMGKNKHHQLLSSNPSLRLRVGVTSHLK